MPARSGETGLEPGCEAMLAQEGTRRSPGPDGRGQGEPRRAEAGAQGLLDPLVLLLSLIHISEPTRPY